MQLPIVINPNPLLRTKTVDVPLEDIHRQQFQKLVHNMIGTMHRAKGIGLAGPQVGQLHRLTVIDIGTGPQVFINPYISSAGFRQVLFEEGCLSIPGVYGWVKRPEKIAVKYLDLNGKKHRVKFDGLMARVLQHEIDHLDGVLFIDKVEEYTKREQIVPEYPHI